MLTPSRREPRRMRGFTLVELMIVIAVVGILMMIGLPSMSLMLKNGQVRTAAESASAGLQFARNEAIRRNATVRFQLTSDLTNSCTLSSAGTSWVVSLATPAGSCASTPIDPSNTAPANPAILQKRSGTEGTKNVTVSGVDGSATPVAANTVIFNGVGRLSGGSTNLSTLDFSHTVDACQTAATPGPVRCLRIMVSTGGTIKMCDPAVASTDSRFCGL